MVDLVAQAAPVAAGAPSSSLSGWYTWSYDHRMDTQKRVQFPADWRNSKTPSQFVLIMWPHAHLKGEREFAFIKGVTPQKFSSLVEQVSTKGIGEDDTGAFRRQIFRSSIQVELDPAGRLCLPPKMVAETGMKKDVHFVGAGDHFELWDKEIFDRCSQADRAVALGAYKTLS
jgi:MraZ protein